jgi:UDP-N-acetylglucosamine--N-acetylmuramyl-(pentapeptide) pyrophosphoryl-undecaprenol N-acetylglucosamine transferase
VWSVLAGLLERFDEVLHVAGRQGAAEVERLRPAYPNYRGLAFSDDMDGLMAEADLAVSRAGIGTIGELTAVGLPMLLVPGTFGGRHQELNAEAVAEAGAAAWVPDAEFTGARLLGELDGLRADPDRLRGMAAASAMLGRPDAAERVLRVVEEVARR